MRYSPFVQSPSLASLESPFLDEEIVARPREREALGEQDWTPKEPEADAGIGEAHADAALPFQVEAFDEVGREVAEEAAYDEEIVGSKDDRTMVADTVATPNRWICAIDVLTANPKYPSPGQDKYLIKSRGTGVLIGPRHVLTAAHVLGRLNAQNGLAEAVGFTVSPGRDGDNSSNPLGKIAMKTFGVQPLHLRPITVGQGAQARQVQVNGRDDYALIILDKDVSATTHKKMTGRLAYWGSDPSVATVRRLDVSDLDGKNVVVAGYPGDTCGKDKWIGTQAQKQPKIDNCWNWRKDEWASRQWRCDGVLSVDPDQRTLYHTADTYEGQSGGPIYFRFAGKLQLAGIHTNEHSAQQNKGVRVTTGMLTDLRDWINAEAGFAATAIVNDTLVFQPPPAKAAPPKPAKELLAAPEDLVDDAEQSDLQPESGDLEADPPEREES